MVIIGALGIIGGSSLRVLGGFERGAASVTNDRFIPACAGTFRASPSSNWWWSVHPCVCWEGSALGMMGFVVYVSSLRVRGGPSL